MISPGSRPVFLQLWRIRFPAAAATSLLHRVSGLLLFLALPAGLYALDRSLADEAGFRAVIAWLQGPIGGGVLLLFGWALVHHLLAGVRLLLADLDVGVERDAARRSAWVTLLLPPIILLLGVALWR